MTNSQEQKEKLEQEWEKLTTPNLQMPRMYSYDEVKEIIAFGVAKARSDTIREMDKKINVYFEKKINEELAKSRRQAVEEVKGAFIQEFCNDHDPTNPPRWLRGVAFDMPDLLRLILEFFDGLTEKGGEEMKVVEYPTVGGGRLKIKYDEKAPCRVCGLPVISASMGGTNVCSWCDCGGCRFCEDKPLDIKLHLSACHSDRLESEMKGDR